MYIYDFLDLGKIIETSLMIPLQIGRSIIIDGKRHIIRDFEIDLGTNGYSTNCRIYVMTRIA